MKVKKGGYNFNAVEKKWQQFWEERKTFKANDCDDSNCTLAIRKVIRQAI
jgi:leucyl-tRNA synthetase